MAITGPKPQPPELKLLRGNPGRRRIKRDAAKPPRASVRAPNGLPPVARREWRRVAPVLLSLGIFTELDRTALADYCLCVARLAECEADLAERGVLVPGDRGLVKNPSAQLAREYRVQVARWCAEFGLTPSSRSRMTLPGAEDVDPFEEFLAGRQQAASGE